MQDCRSIINLDTNIFINKLKKRGLLIDPILKSNLVNFEKYCRNYPEILLLVESVQDDRGFHQFS